MNGCRRGAPATRRWRSHPGRKRGRRRASRKRATASLTCPRAPALQPELCRDENDAVVFDVGARRSWCDDIAKGREVAIAVVVGEQLVGAETEFGGARERVRRCNR